MWSRFSSVTLAPSFELEGVNSAFENDPDENKINLSLTSWREDDGSAWLTDMVRGVEYNMATDPKMNHEYYHPLGNIQFRDSTTKFLFGEDHLAVTEGRAFAVQTLGGNTGLRLALEFLTKQMAYKRFYIAAQASEDEKHVFTGHNLAVETREYYYWDHATRNISFQDMIADLKRAPEDSVVVLQVCCHNPTGSDLTKKQWVQIADVMQEGKLFPLFDAAYLGLGSGDVDEDAWPVRYFADRGFELLCSQTFSNNLGIYDCRVGSLTFVVNDTSVIQDILSEACWNFYNIYGTPAQHGAKIVLNILENPKLRNLWKCGLKKMWSRLGDLRCKLQKRLVSSDCNLIQEWSHITQQKGLFCYTGLSEKQTNYLMNCCHIYMERDGRINVSALNHDNVDYVAACIRQAVETYSLTFNNNILSKPHAG